MNAYAKYKFLNEILVQFNNLDDYYKCLEFLDKSNFKYKHINFNSSKKSATITVNNKLYKILNGKFGI